jgi:hypothetical protein
VKIALSPLELSALRGEVIAHVQLRVLNLALRWRVYGLQAWALGDDLEVVRCFQQSANGLAKQTLEWAVSMRLYGLALIRVQREVEGTFALEKADATLEKLNIQPFSLEELLEAERLEPDGD